jgi:uncharacterized protein
MAIDPEFLAILACPACKSDLVLKEERLLCVECGRAYPIRDGFPVLLIDEATCEGDLTAETQSAQRQTGTTDEHR